ncbi:MAG: MFS transporter [Pseudomonadota bacterium]
MSNQAAPAPPATPTAALPLFNRGFVVMSLAAFLTFCNMAVFFAFGGYLRTLPVDPAWHGAIIGIFALVPLLLRPVVSPFCTPANAVKIMVWSSLGVAACLFLYNLAQGTASLMLVRVLHGAVYVLLMSANLAGVVGCINPQKSGQAFGYMAVIVLLPYAVIPPAMTWAGQRLGGYLYQLNLTALLMLLIPPLLLLLRGGLGQGGAIPVQRPSRQEIIDNLRQRPILCLLGLALLVYTSFAALFFYLQGFAQGLGLANPGWFFTCSTLTEILVRVIAGGFFDRGSKRLWLGGSLALLLACFLLLHLARSQATFLGLGFLFGLALGVAMPLINALAFDLSAPRLRAFNSNLGMQMFQGGFFLGPLLGGWLLALAGYTPLFLACAGLCLLALLLLPGLGRGAD